MSRLYYMALRDVGPWRSALSQSGAQLAPYRSYLNTARKAAYQRALALAWRLPSAEEQATLVQRLQDRFKATAQRRENATRRRDRGPTRDLPRGVWVVLEPPKGRAEEPETTFESFLKADDVFVTRNCQARDGITVHATDEEGRALLLSREPPEEEPHEDEAPDAPTPRPERLLFLRPNTRVIDVQRRALENLENRPTPRLAPLLRLVSPQGIWLPPSVEALAEDGWMILRRRGGVLRDGTLEQRAFVEKALATPDFAVLEGPPGSGKTTAICELILQLAREGKRTLLVASTHVAVDNVIERLLAWQDERTPPGEAPREKLVLPVRIGDEVNITAEAVKPWCLHRLLETWRAEVLDHLEKPQGVEPEGTAARKMLREALQDDRRSAVARLLLDASNLVCGTTIGVLQHPAIKAEEQWDQALRRAEGAERAKLLQDPPTFEPFDVMILDEASKTTLTEFLVPASFAKRWVVVGDIRQLSPYVEEQDLAENLRGLLTPHVARAAVHTFLASDAVSAHERVSSVVAIPDDDDNEELTTFAHEAHERNVAMVHLDTLSASPLRGVNGAVPDLLFADLVTGSPEALVRWQHRLPGDLRATAGEFPVLPDWEAHRAALGTKSPEEPLDWAHEVAWRLVRTYELRQNEEDGKRRRDELAALPPKTLDERYFSWRRTSPRTLRDGQVQTASDRLAEDLANIQRVAMPSILEILQRGAGALPGWSDETVLTHGLRTALPDRMVSLSFQHRMHPHISAFPRASFYKEGDLLRDASGMEAARAWGYPRYASRAVWLDIRPNQRSIGGGNRNPAEADAVITELTAFVEWARTHRRPDGAPWEVAVLPFYRGQETELRRRLQAASRQVGNTRNFRFPKDNTAVHVTLCTVDRFQGHEADLVLLSFVKTHGAVGFLNSPNRLNVALTRARYQIVLVGHRAGFAQDKCPSDLLRRLARSDLYSQNLGWTTP